MFLLQVLYFYFFFSIYTFPENLAMFFLWNISYLYLLVADAASQQTYTLALSFKVGTIYLMSTYDDVCPRIINTKLTGKIYLVTFSLLQNKINNKTVHQKFFLEYFVYYLIIIANMFFPIELLHSIWFNIFGWTRLLVSY